MRTSVFGLLLFIFAFAATGSGCTVLDRDSYSLILKKKAHFYRDLAPPRKAKTDKVRSEVKPAPAVHIGLEPFRPFDYCYHHRSSHIFESVTAILAVPVDVPISATDQFIDAIESIGTGKYPRPAINPYGHGSDRFWAEVLRGLGQSLEHWSKRW